MKRAVNPEFHIQGNYFQIKETRKICHSATKPKIITTESFQNQKECKEKEKTIQDNGNENTIQNEQNYGSIETY